MERGSNSSVFLTVQVAGGATKAAYRQAATECAKVLIQNKKLKGWRESDASKVPMDMVVQLTGGKHDGANMLQNRAVELLSERECPRAIKEAGIQAIGEPELAMDTETLGNVYKPGESLPLRIRVDVWPSVEWEQPYSGLAFEVKKGAVDRSKAEKAMENLRERYTDLTNMPADYAAVEGDAVLCDMHGFEVGPNGAKGEPLPQVAGGDDLEMVLEPGRFLPGLSEGLYGVKAGESREVEIQFGPQVRFEELQNKKAIFRVDVKTVRTRQKPEVDDAFADKIRAGLTLAELEKEVQSAVGDEASSGTKANRDEAIQAAVRGVAKVEVPDTLIAEQAQQKFAVMLQEMAESGMPEEDVKKMVTKDGFKKYKDLAYPGIFKDISTGLILAAVAEAEGITADEIDIEDQMALVREQYKDEAQFDENKARGKIESTLEKEAVLDWLAEKSDITFLEPDDDEA